MYDEFGMHIPITTNGRYIHDREARRQTVVADWSIRRNELQDELDVLGREIVGLEEPRANHLFLAEYREEVRDTLYSIESKLVRESTEDELMRMLGFTQ